MGLDSVKMKVAKLMEILALLSFLVLSSSFFF